VESAQVEVVAVGREALFVAAATDPDNNPLTYAWDFGDGGVAVGAQAPHAFTVPGSLVVTVRVSDGLATATSSFTMTVLAPSSGGGGVTNISQDNGTVVANPLNSVKVSVANSIGAVIELFVDLQALVREDFTVETSFELPSRQAFPLAHGVRPVVKFEHHGLGVASSNVTRVSTGQTEGKARKMLAVSVLETDDGELPKLPKPSSCAMGRARSFARAKRPSSYATAARSCGPLPRCFRCEQTVPIRSISPRFCRGRCCGMWTLPWIGKGRNST
jgi:hypothetical protein